MAACLNVLVRLQRVFARISSNEDVLPELGWLRDHCDNVVQSERRRVTGNSNIGEKIYVRKCELDRLFVNSCAVSVQGS